MVTSASFRRNTSHLGMLALYAALAVQHSWADDVPARKWTDSSGNYSIEAGYVDVENGDVRLRKSDGNSLLVPFKLLSTPDQNYVRSRLRRRLVEQRRKPLPVADLRTDKIDAADPDTKTLYGVNWYPVDSVSTVAGGKNPKPVMWFRVLGALDGFM